MDRTEIIGLVGFFLACFAAATTGAFFQPGPWYERLAKPWWRPPNWLFPPAWSLLYCTIAVSGWLVWRAAGPAGAPVALGVYAAQLTLNAGWSALFFGLRRPDLAFGEVVLLWLSILATILVFYPIHHGAAWLLVPYLCWVTFAACLNFAIWRMNAGRVVTAEG
jgi:tryptophan-rich sensory protein